jgi:hypothetical protein
MSAMIALARSSRERVNTFAARSDAGCSGTIA